MKGYCDICHKVIDEAEIFRFGESIVCNTCYLELKEDLGLDFSEAIWKINPRQPEKKEKLPEPKIYTVHDEATLSCPCGQRYIIKNAFKPKEKTEPENKKFLIMKEGIIYDLNKIDMIEGLKLDFFRADYFLTRKESKPYLCQICLLFDTCQNNFDYECIEASDFLFNKETIFTVKDDFLDSLIKKNNKALRG